MNMEPITAQMPDATLGFFLLLEVVLLVGFFLHVKKSQ